MINGLASTPPRSLSYARATFRNEKSSHMQIPSFVPKITRGVVGSFSSSSYHLGFVYVCVCMCAGNNTSFPQSARHRHPPPTSPTLIYSLNQGCGKERISDKMKRPSVSLPAQYSTCTSCLPKREGEVWKYKQRSRRLVAIRINL